MMEEKELIQRIIGKKEFSQLPELDVKLALGKFEKRQVGDEEKIRLTRELLHKVFSSFTSHKLLSPKNKPREWILRKHLSTRERLPYYSQIYSRILKNFNGRISLIDFGAGINGFSYCFFEESGVKVDYTGIESVGQLVNLTNDYFKKEKISGKAIHLSLFEIGELKKLIKKTEEPRIIFIFKTFDSLEMIRENYSLELIKEISPLGNLIVISFATRSMISKKPFKAKRNWIIEFINQNYKIKDDFELGNERYICFTQK